MWFTLGLIAVQRKDLHAEGIGTNEALGDQRFVVAEGSDGRQIGGDQNTRGRKSRGFDDQISWDKIYRATITRDEY